MKKHLAAAVATVALVSTVCFAGERTEGKYSGTVIFDRWEGCTLYSGICLMYISQDVKEQLRTEAGKCVQVEATEVDQPRNPGDGLFKKLVVLGPAPAGNPWESPDGLKLDVASVFVTGEAPEFSIRVKNISDTPKTLNMDSLAPTLLAAKTKGGDRWSPSDGPSTAVVTRQSFWIGGSDEPRMQGANDTWQWKVTSPQRLQKNVTLDPQAVFALRLSFKLPAGEYEFLAGYGGGVHAGQSIASNLIGFDVNQDGTAALAEAADK